MTARRNAIVLCLITLAPFSAQGQADSWLKTVSVLANDSMRGRETGSREHHFSAMYIAEQFRRAGLRPAGDRGYLQHVPFVARRPVEEQSLVEVIRGTHADTLRFGTDISVNVSAALAPNVEAPLVFAGYGLFIPEKGVDDLASLDLKDKIVVVLSGGPKSIAGPILSNAQSVRWRELRKRGATGLITISDPRTSDIPADRAAANRVLPRMALT